MRRTVGWGRQFLLGTSIVGVAIAVLAVGAGNAANPGTNGTIAFQGYKAGVSGSATVYTVNPDGSGLFDLTQNALDNEWYHDFGSWTVAWSPDGSRLAFDAVAPITDPPVNPAADQCQSDQSIWAIEPGGTDVQALLCSTFPSLYITPSQMSFAPDGSKLVVDSQRDSADQSRLYLVDVDAGSSSLLAEPGFETCDDFSDAWVAAPSWSPTGGPIAFARGGCAELDGIWTMESDTSDLTRVTTGYDWSPDWSPDGSKVVFVRKADSGFNPDFAVGAIYVVNAAGGTPELLTDVGLNQRPVWSPDGTKIAFASDRDPDSSPDMDIFVMNADGTDVQQLTDLQFRELSPSWQPLATSDPDADDDGVDDSIDTGVSAFDDGDGTTGSIVDAALLDVFVTDADDAADGVKITVGPGSGKAKLSVCGFTIQVSAGSEVVVTCGSVTVEVVSGAAEIELSESVVVSVPAGGLAKATDNGDGTFEIENLGGTNVVVTVDGQETTVPPGESTTVSTDTIDPTITGSAAPAPDGLNGWNLGNVTVSFTCLDADSGINSCTAPVTLSSEGAGQSVMGSAVDNAGNSASTTVTGIKIDKTNPSLACIPATFVLNQPSATVSANVSDAISGPAAASASSSVSTSSVGTFAAAVTGADAAGRTTTVSCGYQVRYAFTGFQQPIDNPPIENRENAGKKIPVVWRVTDYNGVGVSSPSSFTSVTWTTIACSPTAPHDAIETSGTGKDLRYLGNGNWQYNWKTLKSFKKTCVRMQLNLADGVAGRVAIFRFK